MVAEGFLFGGALLLVSLLLAWLAGWGWAVPGFILTAFVLYFFRDPERIIPAGDAIISPADGRIMDVRQMELDGKPVWKISIFLSIFNVHVNRAPMAGTIRNVQYQKGQFLVASRPEASTKNEQNTVTVQGERHTVTFRQIAGLIARRIVFRKKIGDHVEKGERVGLIRFGSRVDLFLPLEFSPAVKVGDIVQGGASIMANLVQQESGAAAGAANARRGAGK